MVQLPCSSKLPAKTPQSRLIAAMPVITVPREGTKSTARQAAPQAQCFDCIPRTSGHKMPVMPQCSHIHRRAAAPALRQPSAGAHAGGRELSPTDQANDCTSPSLSLFLLHLSLFLLLLLLLLLLTHSLSLCVPSPSLPPSPSTTQADDCPSAEPARRVGLGGPAP